MKLTVNIGEAQKLSGPSQTPPKLGQQQFSEPKEWRKRNKG